MNSLNPIPNPMALELPSDLSTELTKELIAMNDRITINGITYVKEQQPPDCVKFYFMHDGFRFSGLKGDSLQEIAIEASYIACKPEGAWGALCPAILMRGKEEIRRVGPVVHARGVGESMHGWNEQVSHWIEVVGADRDIMRLLAEKINPSPLSCLNRVKLEFVQPTMKDSMKGVKKGNKKSAMKGSVKYGKGGKKTKA